MQRGTKQKSIYQHVNDDHFQVKNQGFLLLSFCLYAFLFLQWQNKKEGNGTPLQYSCLENPMDKGAWWAAVHGVTGSRTQLSDFIFTFHFHALEKEMATHSSILNPRDGGA